MDDNDEVEPPSISEPKPAGRPAFPDEALRRVRRVSSPVLGSADDTYGLDEAAKPSDHSHEVLRAMTGWRPASMQERSPASRSSASLQKIDDAFGRLPDDRAAAHAHRERDGLCVADHQRYPCVEASRLVDTYLAETMPTTYGQ
jgi:hypothetical protein